MSITIRPSAVSAPGKVLLAGGYLVLDPAYSGLVFALSARIHAVSSEGSSPNHIIVRSPQFSGAEWSYNISVSNNAVSVTSTPGSPKNPFVETTLRYALTYLPISSPLPGTNITIYADNDYYSQPSPSVPRFNNLNTPIESAHKTGLGSSAALTTALTGCLLSTFSPTPLDLSSASTITKIHNLAQAAHCAAQGKIGSGFDVAAAVFGSHVYHRFSPSILEAVGDAGSEGFVGRLKEAVEKEWDLQVSKTKVPKGLRLLMGDVDCGSSTPGMVRKVLAWRKENAEEAKKDWDKIEELNKELIGLFQQEVVDVATVKKKVAEIRSRMKGMGEKSGVEIEPDAQSRLLDAAIEAVEGVIGGVVPGAGGYDAVVFLMEDKEETVEALKKFLRSYQFESAGGKGKVEPLGTREEREGIRVESLESY